MDCETSNRVKLPKSKDTYSLSERKGKDYLVLGSEKTLCQSYFDKREDSETSSSEERDAKSPGKEKAKVKAKEKSDKDTKKETAAVKRRCTEKTSPSRAAVTPKKKAEPATLKGMTGAGGGTCDYRVM